VTDLLLVTLGISMGLQALLFVLAATFRTDKVTDLSYGLTFCVLALVLIRGAADWTSPAAVLAMMVVGWGLRLAGYLFYRILRIGRDARFDGVREKFWAFARFWFFQGLAAWIIMLPVTLWFALADAAGPWSAPMVIGGVVWAAGLAIETVADAQKFADRMRKDGRGRWTDRGLWQYSRHPNYFGELLCWWGIFVFVAPALGWWAAVGLAGPVTITGLLLYVTGIPTLEASANRKWGADPDYAAYRRRTNQLVPWPRPVRKGA
jgi:steroid 5-alpha reductase family enzyme